MRSAPSLSDVLAHLRGELFAVGEGRVGAEMRHELDLDLLAIEIAVEIEEIDLDHRLSCAEGRARPDIACALIAFALVLDADGVDAVGNVLTRGERQIGGGETEALAAARAALDCATHAPPIAELLCRLFQLALAEMLAHLA